jgi:cyclophilin family peptidyl-prolyl cis-trans isomerase
MASDEAPPSSDPTAKVEVTPEELAVAFSGPSYAASKFYITLGSSGVRIAFAEVSPEFGKAPVRDALSFRTAVTLSYVDAIALHRILRNLVKDAEAEGIKQGLISPEAS